MVLEKLEMKNLPVLNTDPPTMVLPVSDDGKSFVNLNTILIDELHHVAPTHCKRAVIDNGPSAAVPIKT